MDAIRERVIDGLWGTGEVDAFAPNDGESADPIAWRFDHALGKHLGDRYALNAMPIPR